jgi:hypothetical protein
VLKVPPQKCSVTTIAGFLVFAHFLVFCKETFQELDLCAQMKWWAAHLLSCCYLVGPVFCIVRSVYIAISIHITLVVHNLMPLYTPCSHYFVLHFQGIYLHHSFMIYKVLLQSFHSYMLSGASIVCFRTCICKSVVTSRRELKHTILGWLVTV